MLQFFSLFALALALVQGAALPEVEARSTPQPLKLDFTVSKTVGNSTAQEFWAKYGNKKRDAYPETLQQYQDLSYLIDVYLGSDGQKNTVALDTGSSDLWVPSTGYSPSSSSSSQDTGEAFQIGYVDGSGTTGEYYLDTLTFSTESPVVSGFQFALASTNSGSGILGVADKDQEASQYTYNNLPWALQAAGITPKASYSLYLNPDNESGSIIFGGIDTDKYQGELAQYNIDSSLGGLGVNLASVNFGGEEITANVGALLDSGTSLGLLPEPLISKLDQIFKTTIVQQGPISYRETSCNQPSDKYLEFNFGSNTVSIPYDKAIVQQDDGTCLLGFGSDGNYLILGDVFLRQAYVYYDLTDQTISLGSASYSSSSNIISA